MDTAGLRAEAEALLALHEGPKALVLPNAWDPGSARLIEHLGFPVIATTSSGIAYSLGEADGEVLGRDEMLDCVAEIVDAVDVPVTADLEGGYGPDPRDVADTIRGALEAGIVGGNIEDGTKDGDDPLFDIELGVERIQAGREAADSLGIPFVINARTDGFLRIGAGTEVLADAIARANAYREAGASCLYVPGKLSRDTIATLVREIDGPLNVLGLAGTPPVPDLEAMGVRRVSLGGGIQRATMTLIAKACAELSGSGGYGFLTDTYGNRELNELFAD